MVTESYDSVLDIWDREGIHALLDGFLLALIGQNFRG